MATVLELDEGVRLRCDSCPRWGTESWAQDHARGTGHQVFTVTLF